MARISDLWYVPKDAKKPTGKYASYSETMLAYIPYADIRRAKMDAYHLLKQGKVMDSYNFDPKYYKKGYYMVSLKTESREGSVLYAVVAMYKGKVYYENQTSARPTVYEIDALGNNVRKVRNIYTDA